MARYPIQVLESRIHMLDTAVFGGGGVIFDQFEWEGLTDCGKIVRPRRRSHVDGQGISFLRAVGIRVIIASSVDTALAALVGRWNDLPSCQSGAWSPVEIVSPSVVVANLRASEHVSWAIMGAEFAHWSMLENASLRLAAGDAAPEIKSRCDWIAERPGGAGAVRDLADYILRVRSVDPFSLPTS